MAGKSICNLGHVRTCLGKSQAELAALVGVSPRAIQSYEQGWRPCPPYVQKLVGLMVYLKWRKSRKTVHPCWKQRNCSKDHRESCTVFSLGNGELCWLLSGNRCQGKKYKSWQAKLEACAKCPVMKAWIPA
jgi:hypothetical protein